jgi:hypothetical protein
VINSTISSSRRRRRYLETALAKPLGGHAHNPRVRRLSLLESPESNTGCKPRTYDTHHLDVDFAGAQPVLQGKPDISATTVLLLQLLQLKLRKKIATLHVLFATCGVLS